MGIPTELPDGRILVTFADLMRNLDDFRSPKGVTRMGRRAEPQPLKTVNPITVTEGASPDDVLRRLRAPLAARYGEHWWERDTASAPTASM